MDNESLTYYDILCVEPGATLEQIKANWRKLARQFHPDKNPDDPQAAQKFARLQEAYAVLSDAALRAQYDERSHTPFLEEDRDIRTTAEGLIIMHATQWVQEESNDRSTADMLADLSVVFTQLQTQAQDGLLEGDKIAARLTRQIAKLKRKSKGRDFLTIALETRRRGILETRHHFEKQVKACALARVLLQEYDFECVKVLTGVHWTTMGTGTQW